MPPDFYIVDADSRVLVPQRPYQVWLWECWTAMIANVKRIIGADPFDFVINGDLIEGGHHKGTQIWSSNPSHHVDAAMTALAPIVEMVELGGGSVYVVRGTECHTNTDEHKLGEKLRAIRRPQTGLAAWDHLALEYNGCRCSFRHHISPSSRVYLEAGALSAHLGNEQLECVRAKWPVPDVIFRAHRHRHGCYDDGCAMAVVTAAWQGETRHVHKVAVSAVSRPSWVLADWRGLAHGELPQIRRRVYTPPVGGAA